jgi:hypothetical protein
LELVERVIRMSHSLRYRVHGMNEVPQIRKVMFEGKEIEAPLPALEVELSWDMKDGRDHSTTTLRFMGAEEVAWARDVFVTDGSVDVTYDKVSDKAAPSE